MLKEFTTPKTTGKDIKNNIKNVLSKKYGVLNTRNIFDNIPDKAVEDNIEIAQNTIQTNIDRGALNKSLLPKLPYLRDGLSVSFAASDMGNSKAATKAREAAYTEEPLVKSTGNKLLSTQIPKPENAILKTNKKPEMINLIDNPNEKANVANLLLTNSESDKDKKQNLTEYQLIVKNEINQRNSGLS